MSAPHVQADGATPSQPRSFAVAVAVILVITIYVRRMVHPLDHVAWSYQVLGLCLLVACIAGRTLIGRSARNKVDVRWPAPAIWVGLALAAILPHLASLRVGLLSDDFGLVYAMSQVDGPLEAMRDLAYRGLFRPISLLIYWLGVRGWHGSGAGYHALSLVLHVANTLLVFALGKRWIGSTYGAAVAAALFAVHPLHVEAIVWIPCHSDLLYTGFGLASLLCLEGYLTAPPPRRWHALAGVALFFAAALLGKEAAIAIPALALLRLALLPPKPSLRQAITAAAVYALPVIPYIPAYLSVVGRERGYPIPLTFWNTVFPSTPLVMMGDFLFPVHRTLFGQAGPWLWWVAVLAMGAGALWWTRGLTLLPGKRLWFWIGTIFVLAIPVWVYSAESSGILENSRRAYFPTVALVWLFGDICAARGLSLRKSGAVAAATILLAGILTPWYITPWSRAGRLAQNVLSAGIAFVQSQPPSNSDATIYVRRLPEMAYGVPVFRNCFPQAISFAVGRNAPIRVVTDTPSPGSIHPEEMAHWALRPGESLIAWNPETGEMKTVRVGARHSPVQAGPPGENNDRQHPSR